jgi:hypothetical protein
MLVSLPAGILAAAVLRLAVIVTVIVGMGSRRRLRRMIGIRGSARPKPTRKSGNHRTDSRDCGNKSPVHAHHPARGRTAPRKRSNQ